MNAPELKKQHKSFGGSVEFYTHASQATQTPMNFSVYRPDKKDPHRALYFLSGLTCTEKNFITKAHFQKWANEYNFLMICPDTSPRGLSLPGEHDSYDFGSGAGFYLNATQDPWSKHYRMEEYIAEELYALALEHFFVQPEKFSIMGHSMGGHGALTLGLKYSKKFKSISAFSPIVSPTNCPWGLKALEGYLGKNHSAWQNHDATELLRSCDKEVPIFIQQGDQDEFLETQLKPELLLNRAKELKRPITYKLEKGYDHSYYFINTFIGEHLEFHWRQQDS